MKNHLYTKLNKFITKEEEYQCMTTFLTILTAILVKS